MDFERHFRVPEQGFRLADRDPADRAGLDREQSRARRAADTERLVDLQRRLYAEGRRALLVVLQGLDASGKDGTIRHVMSGVNPQGVAVTSFKEPSQAELDHSFLWRTQKALPARGMIGVFNRSHYEEVAVVRVHPELLAAQGTDPARAGDPAFWAERFQDIRAWERHLSRTGTRVVKFFLHVSKAEQRRRFLDRIERADKHWKFSAADIRAHQRWDEYQPVYEEALQATSTAREPWYVIPADHKWLMRTAVGAIVVAHLEDMDPRYPDVPAAQRREIEEAGKLLLETE